METLTLEWCQRLIGCRSVTREGTRAIAVLCAEALLRPRGIEARLLPSITDDRQVNLIARVAGRDATAAPLVLNTHLDTVPPGAAALWTACAGDPFTATITGDRIYGLGAADTKLDFVGKALALAECGRPQRDVYLVATFGEEHGLVGAKELAQAKLLPRGALAFVGEPSRLQVITAHKGLMVFTLELRFTPELVSSRPPLSTLAFAGRAAHSSTPALGINAIGLALEALVANPAVRVARLEGGDAVNKVPAHCTAVATGAVSGAASAVASPDAAAMPIAVIPAAVLRGLARFIARLEAFAERAGPAEPDYASPTLTCNPGVLRTGDGGTVTLEFELRPPPAMELEPIRAEVAAIATTLATELPGIDLTLVPGRANPGFRSSSASATVALAMAALAAARLPLDSGVKAGCTEAGIYAAAGLHPIVFGPGPSTGVIHAPNEYNFLAEVAGALRFYRELLKL